MKRSKKYQKLKEQVSPDVQKLREECENLVEEIIKLGEIDKQNLFIALAIRLKIPFDECFIKKFNLKMLEKAKKELTYML